MKITAEDLQKLQIVEWVIPEPEPACEENLPELAERIRERLDEFLVLQKDKTEEMLVKQRYDRFRKF